MKNYLAVVLFLALSAAFAFGSRIDQGSTDSGHTANCTPNNLGGTINDTSSPCVFFVSTGASTGFVESTFNGTTSILDDVFTFDVSSSSAAVVFTPSSGFDLTSAAYGLFLCSGPTQSDQNSGGSSNTNYTSMAIVSGGNKIGNAPCMNLPVPDSNISESPTGSFTYNLAGLQADGLTNSTLAFIAKHGEGSFSMGSSSGVPEPSSAFLLLSGAIGVFVSRFRTALKR